MYFQDLSEDEDCRERWCPETSFQVADGLRDVSSPVRESDLAQSPLVAPLAQTIAEESRELYSVKRQRLPPHITGDYVDGS